MLELFVADMPVIVFVFLCKNTFPSLRKMIIHISCAEHLAYIFLGNVAFFVFVEKVEGNLNILVIEELLSVIGCSQELIEVDIAVAI